MPVLIRDVLSIALGVILAVRVLPKLRHPKGFVLIVWEYQILPRPLATIFACSAPVVELFLGLLLLEGSATLLAAAGASSRQHLGLL